MTDDKRIASLEAKILEMEIRFGARMEGLVEMMTALHGATVDALAMIALRDRALVENLLKMRRLTHQAHGSGTASAELIKIYEGALDLADRLSSARPLGPQ